MMSYVSAVTVAVRDMPRALSFYVRCGFDIVYGGPEATFSSLRSGDAHVNLILKPDYAPRWWGRAIFHVEDVDALYASITAQGLMPHNPPRDARWGERFFHITDPDGHELSFAKRFAAVCAVSTQSRRGAADVEQGLKQRLDRFDWQAMKTQLREMGYCKTPPLLAPDECEALIRLYPDDIRFRSRIEMSRYRFGEGEYKYFADPLPPLVQTLRSHTYPPLAAVANEWMAALRKPTRYPDTLPAFLDQCRAAGQTRPTPLLLRYESGGYNCLHQDLYGEVAFPLQLTCFLSRPDDDYTGGAFLLVEQRPRAQSRAEAITPAQGEMVIFATQHRPVQGKRGYHRTTMRHGVSRVTSGRRYTLGIIYHNAQ
jgi:catechol 2,3-dioxygenase-like lactoylglutathione lyase family enzyme